MATKQKPPAKAKAPAAAPAQPAPQPNRVSMLDQALGQVVRIMASSPRHRHLFIADLEWMVMPALGLGQARVILDKDGLPAAFACWALLSEEVEKRLMSGNRRLAPQEWRSGDRLWLIDVVAPDPALPTVVALLQKEVFKGAEVMSLIKLPKPAAKAPKAG